MKSLMTLFLAVGLFAGAGASQEQKQPGFGELHMRVDVARLRAQHKRAAARIDLNEDQRKRLANIDRRYDEAIARWVKPYMTTPFDEVPKEAWAGMLRRATRMHEDYQKELKGLMGETDYAKYQKEYDLEQAKHVLAGIIKNEKRLDERRDRVHELSLTAVDLDAKQLKKVAEIEKWFRAARAEVRRERGRVLPRPENQEKMLKVHAKRRQLEAELRKRQTEAMGAENFRAYTAAMQAGIRKEQASEPGYPG